MVVIDGHTHFAAPERGYPPCTVEELLRVMDLAGIDAVVTCPPYSSIDPDRNYDEANAYLARSMEEAPNRIFAFLRVNPHNRDHTLEAIERGVLEQGFYGVKLHPRNEAFPINSEELTHPIAEKAAKMNVPILIHTGEPDTYGYAQPTLVGGLADVFPEVTLIVGHMGKRLVDDAILVAEWFDNIILETSFRSHKDIEKAVRVVGADRVIYGSDMPFGVPEVEMKKVMVADITEEERRLLLGENMARILEVDL